MTSSSGAIVVSTEAQCCVTALGHIRPGDLFAEDGTRTGRACSSGTPGCAWKGIESATPWNDFMETRASEHGKDEVADIYLNAGLIAGKAKDLLRIIKSLDIQEEEDDQAVLTAFMYRNPQSIVLDYDQTMFGNNRWALGEEDGCMFELPQQEGDELESSTVTGRRLVHAETGTSPLFIHSPGQFMECHHNLLDMLQARSSHRDLRWNKKHWKKWKAKYTKHPTKHPTPHPTKNVGPTTKHPTKHPTPHPTPHPTKPPTTKHPTKHPTPCPTRQPTYSIHFKKYGKKWKKKYWKKKKKKH
jgi:hypothetical protein